MDQANPFKWRPFEGEIIWVCVRWYVRYGLSYRDLEEMMVERGLRVDHTTIYRWVQDYAPELEKRTKPRLKLTNDSVEGGRNVYQGQGRVGVPVSSSGLWTAIRSNFSSALSAMPMPLKPFSRKRWPRRIRSRRV